MSSGLIRKMSADFKPLLIDLEGNQKPTGRKREQRERLSEEDIMYCVYWIKDPNHTDINTEGYVGITKDFESRMRHHKRFDFTKVVVDKVRENLSKQQALELELKLRPTEFIGWNKQRGGFIGVDSSWYDDETNRTAHSIATSEATRRGIQQKDTTEKRSERARQNWIVNRESYRNVSVGSSNPKAKLSEENVRDIKYFYIPLGYTNTEIAKKFGVKHYVISFIRSGKNWSHI